MLLNLHVKNLALIEELDVNFTEGLNILTGETGAGKSILIGSVELALGGKIDRDFLRKGTEESLAEIIFSVSDKQAEEIEKMGFTVEDGEVILSRKITANRSVNKVNGETVPVSRLREISSHLIDIHGQHEHQSLLQKKKQLEFLDEFASDALTGLKKELRISYDRYCSLKKELEQSSQDADARAREQAFLEFEVAEIAEANLVIGEDELLEEEYRKLSHGRKIMEAVTEVDSLCGYEDSSAGDLIGRALRTLMSVTVYDEELSGMSEQLRTIDSLLNDFQRDLSSYEQEFGFSEEHLYETEKRLNLINQLKTKHGSTIEKILQAGQEKEKRIEKLQNYEFYLEKLQNSFEEAQSEVERLSLEISAVRKKYAKELSERVRSHLADLNFLDVRFEAVLHKLDDYSANGYDEAEYLIAVNVGEPLKPLVKVASGGELSRVMLALKTVLADKDDVETVIFDEIDSGISGRTAQKVSEKMSLIGRSRQVICITHLPQIASMADSHYLIEKKVSGKNTITNIRKISGSEETQELARMLGGVEITEKVLENARDMKKQADAFKGKN
ncbi:MAG: DNA repair protein RecN [Lachnospiraceae bacterium]